MPREQLEHFVVVVSRWQYDLYHLLTNEARVRDVDPLKRRGPRHLA